jgi:hypothetical protein
MPTLDVRNGFGQKSSVMEWRGRGIVDARGGSDGEYEEVGRRGGSATCDDFVGGHFHYPEVICVEVRDVLSVAIERADGNEEDSGLWSVEDIPEGNDVSSDNIEIYSSPTDCIDRGPADSFDGMGRDVIESPKVGMFRRDVACGT